MPRGIHVAWSRKHIDCSRGQLCERATMICDPEDILAKPLTYLQASFNTLHELGHKYYGSRTLRSGTKTRDVYLAQRSVASSYNEAV